MKKLLLTCGVAALLASAGVAQAQTPPPADTNGPLETWLFATAQLEKNVTTDEYINFTTVVVLNQTVTSLPVKFAESSAMARQINTSNEDCGNCAEKRDTIAGSGNQNTGLVSINQAAGNMNNQGTLVSIAVDVDFPPNPAPPPPEIPTDDQADPEDQGFAHAQAEATQANGGAIIGLPEFGEQFPYILSGGNTVDTINLLYRDATIDTSLNNNTGLVYANQSTGNNNNQVNVLSLAFSLVGQGVALAEADLGQFNTLNHVGEGATLNEGDDVGINKTATIVNSLTFNTGVFGVNQSVGNNGNQANIVSIAAVGSDLPTF